MTQILASHNRAAAGSRKPARQDRTMIAPLVHDRVHPCPLRRPTERRQMPALTYPEAIVVGLFQGVSELFPVSSLGHSVLIPALIGGPRFCRS